MNIFQHCRDPFVFSEYDFSVLPTQLINIGDYAFATNLQLSSVAFQENIETIGNCAFKNTSLKSAVFPLSLQTIGSDAFAIPTLENVQLGNKVSSIGDRCFAESKVRMFSVPTNCLSIGIYAFCGSRLETLSFNYPCSSDTIWDYSFANCSHLRTVYTNDNNIRTIGRSAFECYEGLKEFTLGLKLETIKLNAFKHCTLLKDVIIPDDSCLSLIEALAFEGCVRLKNFKVSSENKNFSSEDGVLYNKQKTEIVIYLPASNRTFFEIPSTVERILAYAFQNAKNLEVVDIASCKINSIGFKAFSGCSKLKKVLLPQFLSTIDSLAFEQCPSMECGSIVYNGSVPLGKLFVDSGIKLSALSPCPTIMFSVRAELNDISSLWIMFEVTLDQ